MGVSIQDRTDFLNMLDACRTEQQLFSRLTFAVMFHQTDPDARKRINEGTLDYIDIHLSHVAQHVWFGFYGDYLRPTSSQGVAGGLPARDAEYARFQAAAAFEDGSG